MKTAKGRISKKKSGNPKYESFWVYIPSKISKDNSFPFKDKEEVIIELKGANLLIRKTYSLSEITERYGFSDATLSKLVTKRAIDNKDWKQAAKQMRNSLWYRQVTNRAERLAKRMENVKDEDEKPKKIIEIPTYHSMTILECDDCRQTALNLYVDKDFKCLAYRCINCNHAGYFSIDLGDDE